MAKEFLSAKGIPYTGYDVTTDKDKAKEMMQKTGQRGVPVIIIDDEVIIGFNRQRLEKVLSEKQKSPE